MRAVLARRQPSPDGYRQSSDRDLECETAACGFATRFEGRMRRHVAQHQEA
jgi:hypothetical protein